MSGPARPALADSLCSEMGLPMKSDKPELGGREDAPEPDGGDRHRGRCRSQPHAHAPATARDLDRPLELLVRSRLQLACDSRD